ncbi:hypothetical protein Tco_0010574 [Tanacetum coccineum]
MYMLAIQENPIGQGKMTNESRDKIEELGHKEKPMAKIDFGSLSHNKHTPWTPSLKKHSKKRPRLRIALTDGNAETVPLYDAKGVSEINASSKDHEQVSYVKCKTSIQTSNDDLYVENNGGTSEHDSNAHDEYHEIQMLAYNVQGEAENQKRLNNELKK